MTWFEIGDVTFKLPKIRIFCYMLTIPKSEPALFLVCVKSENTLREIKTSNYS